MLTYALVFLFITLVTGGIALTGFTGTAGLLTKGLFAIFLVMSAISFALTLVSWLRVRQRA